MNSDPMQNSHFIDSEKRRENEVITNKKIIMHMQLTASNTVTVFTDSQSLCNGLISHTPLLDEIRMRMNIIY